MNLLSWSITIRPVSLAVLICLLGLPPSQAAIELVVDSSDGEVFFRNDGLDPEVFDGYTLTSEGDALLSSEWISVTGNYDLSGDQSVDSVSDWFLIGTPNSSVITEASLTAESAQLDPGQVVFLGELFDLQLTQQLEADVTAGAITTSLVADFRDLLADYNRDLTIDVFDLLVYFDTYGSTDDLRADGNSNGVVDAADYTIWRDAFTAADAVSASAIGIVPEPGALTAVALLLTAWVSSKPLARR